MRERDADPRRRRRRGGGRGPRAAEVHRRAAVGSQRRTILDVEQTLRLPPDAAAERLRNRLPAAKRRIVS